MRPFRTYLKSTLHSLTGCTYLYTIAHILGIYDSGTGGILYAQKLHEIIPSLDIVVLADREHLPLGEKNPQELFEIVTAGMKKLFDSGCSLVLLVCNTASVNTIRKLQQHWLPDHYPGRNILGISSPLIEEVIATVPQNSSSVLLGTQATIQSEFYQKTFLSSGYTAIDYVVCDGLASAIEQSRSEAEHKLIEILSTRDMMKYSHCILACTHYSQYIPEIVQSNYPQLIVIDPLKRWLQRTQEYIAQHPEYPQSYRSVFTIIDTSQS